MLIITNLIIIVIIILFIIIMKSLNNNHVVISGTWQHDFYSHYVLTDLSSLLLIAKEIIFIFCYHYQKLPYTLQIQHGVVSDPSLNPEWSCLYFHIALILFERVWIQLFSFQLYINSREDWNP